MPVMMSVRHFVRIVWPTFFVGHYVVNLGKGAIFSKRCKIIPILFIGIN